MMYGEFPTLNAALRATLKWEAETKQSLIDGTPVSKPPRSKSYSDDEILLALRLPNSNETDPLAIMREKIAALGEEAAEPSHNQILMIDTAAKKADYLTVKPAGLEALTAEQSDELSRAVLEGRVPDDLLSSADLPDSVRLAVARAIPSSTWEAEVLHDRLHGSTGDTGDTGETTEEAE